MRRQFTFYPYNATIRCIEYVRSKVKANNNRLLHKGSIQDDEVGGKAQGLKILRAMGYQVPEYFVIPFTKSIDDPEIMERIHELAKRYDRFAVRSSANIEDGAHASFAGQFESYLDVSPGQILARVQHVRNSVEADRIKEYCSAMGLPLEDIKMNVIIQRFDEPHFGGVWMGSGVTGGRLEWAEGRGDVIVDGLVEPNYESYQEDGSVRATKADSLLTDLKGNSVAEKCKEIQSKLGYDVDLEFCITKNGIQWLQLRRVTRDIAKQIAAEVAINEDAIIGEPASPYTAEGVSYRLDQKRGASWGKGKILIAKATSPADMMFIMAAKGVVTRMGGMLSHSAVVCRELGKACVVGVDIDKIEHNTDLFIDGKAGEVHLR